MVAIVRLKTVGDAALPPGARVLKVTDYRLRQQAQAVLDDARQEARTLVDSAEEALESERHRGYREGTEQARQEAAELMLETVGRCVDYLGDVEEEIVGVTLKAVRKMLGTLDDTALTAALARQALQMVRTQKRVTLRVPPGQEEGVRAKVSEIVSGYSSVSLLEVVPDVGLSDGGCILETELGVVDAGVETQITALERSMLSRFGRERADE